MVLATTLHEGSPVLKWDRQKQSQGASRSSCSAVEQCRPASASFAAESASQYGGVWGVSSANRSRSRSVRPACAVSHVYADRAATRKGRPFSRRRYGAVKRTSQVSSRSNERCLECHALCLRKTVPWFISLTDVLPGTIAYVDEISMGYLWCWW